MRRYKLAVNTIMRIVHQVTAQLPDSITIARMFQPQWSGILVFDGKVISVYDEFVKRLDKNLYTKNELLWKHKTRFLCGVDYGTGDLPHYDLQGSEGFLDLVLYFKALKSIHYPLKVLVCDGNPAIPRAVYFVFGNSIIIQRCTRHFLEDLRRLVQPLEDSDPRRELLLALIGRIKSVIQAKNLSEAGSNYQLLRRQYLGSRVSLVRKMLKTFERAKDPLTSHLQYPKLGLPHTSNDAENLFKQLNCKVRLVERFQQFYYARNYLNAWALLRRFTPFTDCKGKRKYRNHQAPLQLASAEISQIDPLRLRK